MKKLTPLEWLDANGRYYTIGVQKNYNISIMDMHEYAEYVSHYSNEITSIVFALKQKLPEVLPDKEINMVANKIYYGEYFKFIAFIYKKDDATNLHIKVVHNQTGDVIAEVHEKMHNNLQLLLIHLRSKTIEYAYKLYHSKKPTAQLLLEEYDFNLV